MNFRFHDLRREAGSRWIEGGMVLHEVREFLGHAKVNQTDTYLGLNTDRLHEALKRFEAHRNVGSTDNPLGKAENTKPEPLGAGNPQSSVN